LPLSSREEIQSISQSHATRLADELGGVVDRLERAAEGRVAEARREAASERDGLLAGISDSVRKIRAAEQPTAALTELVAVASRFCRRATMLLHSDGTVIGFRSEGGGKRIGFEEGEPLSLQLASAPAIAHAVESRETVAVAATQHNLSLVLCSRLSFRDGEAVTVFPLVLRETVLGVLLIDGEQVYADAVAALILTAEAWVEALGSRRANDAG